MKITFDPAKDAANVAKHGVSLAKAVEITWRAATFVDDIRRDYGEPRLQVYGDIDGRLHVFIFTPADDGVRAISLRKANKREIRRHGRPDVQP